MTIEKIKNIVRYVFDFYEENVDSDINHPIPYDWSEMDEACEEALEALDQVPFMNKPCVTHQVCHDDKVKVLDKIRAEIEFEVDHRTYMLCAEDVLEIIDKYRSESEE